MNAAGFAAVVERARALIQENSADPWITLLGDSRWISAGRDAWHLTEPADGYRFDPAAGVHSGPVGSNAPTANTAVEFAGKAWAMVARSAAELARRTGRPRLACPPRARRR